MKGEKRSFVFWLSLMVYAILLTGLLLYLRYPEGKVEKYLAAKLSSISGGSRVVIGACHYGLPVIFRCESLRFTDEDSGDILALVDRVAITPKLSGWGMKYAAKGEMAGGTFTTEARISFGKERLELNDITVNGVELAEVPLLQQNMQRELRGRIDYSGSLSLEGGRVESQEGSLTVRNGVLPYRQQILLVKEQEMAPFALQMSYQQGKLLLSNGSLESGTLTYSFNGELITQGAMENWAMKVTGTLTPSAEYMAGNPAVQRIVRRLKRQFAGDEIPFMVSGNMRVPRFRFGGQ